MNQADTTLCLPSQGVWESSQVTPRDGDRECRLEKAGQPWPWNTCGHTDQKEGCTEDVNIRPRNLAGGGPSCPLKREKLKVKEDRQQPSPKQLLRARPGMGTGALDQDGELSPEPSFLSDCVCGMGPITPYSHVGSRLAVASGVPASPLYFLAPLPSPLSLFAGF